MSVQWVGRIVVGPEHGQSLGLSAILVVGGIHHISDMR